MLLLRLVCRWLNITATKKQAQALFVVHYNGSMEQPKTRGRPRKPEEEKLVRLVLFVPPATGQKVEKYGQEWARAVLKRAKPPAA